MEENSWLVPRLLGNVWLGMKMSSPGVVPQDLDQKSPNVTESSTFEVHGPSTDHTLSIRDVYWDVYVVAHL